MSKEVKATGRRRAQVDIKKFATGLLLLLKELDAQDPDAADPPREEPAA